MASKILQAVWDEGGRAWAEIGNTYQAFLKAESILPAQFPVYQPDNGPQAAGPEAEYQPPENPAPDLEFA
jgi:hypothetical protein